MSDYRWYVLWLAIAVLIFGLDQGSKALASDLLVYGERVPLLPVLAWTLVHNDGAAFSLLAGAGGWQRWFLAAIAIAFCSWLLFDLRRVPPGSILGYAYALILGGAAGNLHDRISDGYVVDFVLVHYHEWTFPAFNVADSAVTVGACLWLTALVLQARQGHTVAAGGT